MTTTKISKDLRSKKERLALITLCFFAFFLLSFAITAFAQTPSPDVSNPNSSAFKIVICDGPAGANLNKDPKYIPCDFRGLMLQAQHLINIMIVIGVLSAIVGFCYAGYLYITGVPGNISRAHDIFPKVAIGFIIMLTAWFIIYQILSWLTGNSGFGALLGNP